MGTRRSRPSGSKRTSGADNFTLIEGVNTYLDAKLHRAGILTFAQLAALSPEEIRESLGHPEGVTPDRIRSENWIGQARKLAGKKTTAQFVVQLVLNQDRSVSSTKVTHSESYEEEDWIGWDEIRLVRFFVRHGELSLPVTETATGEEKDAVSAGTEAVKSGRGIAKTAARKVPLIGEPQLQEFTTLQPLSRIPSLLLTQGQPFNVRLSFDLPETTAPGEERIEYTTVVYAKSLSRQMRQPVGVVRGAAAPNERVTVEVQATELPEGIYRMEADLTLAIQTAQQSAIQRRQAQLRGSLFQVC
ncbi:MAG: hypothetical protein U0Z53_09490 [Blastocatellia bacterium]